MSNQSEGKPLSWQSLTRPDSIEIEQAPARNNSWYLIVPTERTSTDQVSGASDLRYASQSANSQIAVAVSAADAKRAAEAHADRYDTRE